MFPKNRRPLRRNLPRPNRLLPACPRAPTRAARALAHKRSHPRAIAAIRRHPSNHGATNAIPRAHYYAHAPKRRHPNAIRPAYPHAANRSPGRRLHPDNRRQNPRLRLARKRRYPMLGTR